MTLRANIAATSISLLLAPITVLAGPYPGVPTRSQNPLLQSYFIPAMPVTGKQDWSFSHSLYITNTYQTDSSGSEDLIIDVENTRYDLQATYSHQLWHFNINLSLIDNDSGFMDQNIEGWHDFFGLPQGGRDTGLNDRVDLYYTSAGATVIDTQQGDSGLADIQLAAGYQTSETSQFWFAIELPSTSDSPLISNDAVDLALWYAMQPRATGSLASYGLLGLALPADSGLFKNRLRDHFLFAQLGMIYAFRPNWHFFLQADLHSAMVKNSNLDALDHSLQTQFGLRLPGLMRNYQLDLFFSEDIFPGHAPDITFSLRFSPLPD